MTTWVRRVACVVAVPGVLAVPAACGSNTGEPTATPQGSVSGIPPIQVVVFTHIEDQTPPGVLGTAANRASYLSLRTALLQMATLMRQYKMRWSLEPDWKVLLAALQYEDAATQ